VDTPCVRIGKEPRTAEAAAAFNETFEAEIFAAGDALFDHVSTLEAEGASALPLPAGQPS
jgi:hypothetical protein